MSLHGLNEGPLFCIVGWGEDGDEFLNMLEYYSEYYVLCIFLRTFLRSILDRFKVFAVVLRHRDGKSCGDK